MYALFQLIAFVCNIAIDYFCIHCCNYRQLLDKNYHLKHIFSTIAIDNLSCSAQLTTFVCTIAIDNLFMKLQTNQRWKNNIKIICDIVYNNIHNTKTTLQLLYNLLWTDNVTCGAAVTAKDTKDD